MSNFVCALVGGPQVVTARVTEPLEFRFSLALVFHSFDPIVNLPNVVIGNDFDHRHNLHMWGDQLILATGSSSESGVGGSLGSPPGDPAQSAWVLRTH